MIATAKPSRSAGAIRRYVTVLPSPELPLEVADTTKACGILSTGPVAQWIERQPSKLRAEVRLLPGPPRFVIQTAAFLRSRGGLTDTHEVPSWVSSSKVASQAGQSGACPVRSSS